MIYKIELYKGSELHVRARKQKQLFLGALVLACVLYAVGIYNNPNFFDQGLVFFIVLWCLCVPVAFNGAVCESISEVYAEQQRMHQTLPHAKYKNETTPNEIALDGASNKAPLNYSEEKDLTRSSNTVTHSINTHAWYVVSFVAILTIPAIAAICAVVVTSQPAYLLILIFAGYFGFRNHKLYSELKTSL